MERNEQEKFREVIQKRQAEIETEIADASKEIGAVVPDSAIGRLSRLDTMQIQEMALATKQRLQTEQVRLQSALHRISEGTFGRCAVCGEDIAVERLRFQPDAIFCVPCAQNRK